MRACAWLCVGWVGVGGGRACGKGVLVVQTGEAGRRTRQGTSSHRHGEGAARTAGAAACMLLRRSQAPPQDGRPTEAASSSKRLVGVLPHRSSSPAPLATSGAASPGPGLRPEPPGAPASWRTPLACARPRPWRASTAAAPRGLPSGRCAAAPGWSAGARRSAAASTTAGLQQRRTQCRAARRGACRGRAGRVKGGHTAQDSKPSAGGPPCQGVLAMARARSSR